MTIRFDVEYYVKSRPNQNGDMVEGIHISGMRINPFTIGRMESEMLAAYQGACFVAECVALDQPYGEAMKMARASVDASEALAMEMQRRDKSGNFALENKLAMSGVKRLRDDVERILGDRR